ncbi:MAG: Lsr2 family protein [Nocardioidaceae bacterium]|nr:MAG: Lsr2 family protein [Nocardioidaceae bacterium]
MAQRVDIVLVDDIDGNEAEETLSFALDGVEYEIDLSAKNAAKLRDALATYIGHGRRTGGRRSAGRRASGRTRTTPANNSASAAEIRAWATDNGYELSARGRIPAEIREAYAAAS